MRRALPEADRLSKIFLMDFPSRPATHERAETAPEERSHEFAAERICRPAKGNSAERGAHKDAEFGHTTPMAQRESAVKPIVGFAGDQAEGMVIAKDGRMT